MACIIYWQANEMSRILKSDRMGRSLNIKHISQLDGKMLYYMESTILIKV